MANGITFEDLVVYLGPDALDLFRRMAQLHVSTTGDRRFLESHTFGGIALHFTGPGPSLEDVDGGALQDISSYGLLHTTYGSRGTPNHRLTSDAVRFYRWLQTEGEPIDGVEGEVRRVIAGADFVQRHASASGHLTAALEGLWGDDHSTAAVSTIGDHLRKALMDTTADLFGSDGGSSERPVERLEAYLATRTLGGRDRAMLEALVELARRVLRLDHRLNHVRDEIDKGEPEPTWQELRRAVFVTVLVCYELDQVG